MKRFGISNIARAIWVGPEPSNFPFIPCYVFFLQEKIAKYNGVTV